MPPQLTSVVTVRISLICEEFTQLVASTDKESSPIGLAIVTLSKCTVSLRVLDNTKPRKSKFLISISIFIFIFFYRYCASYYNLSSSFNHDKPGRAPGFGIGERGHTDRKSDTKPDVGKY